MASRMNQMKRTATKEVNKQARLQTGSIIRADNDVGYLMILGGLIEFSTWITLIRILDWAYSFSDNCQLPGAKLITSEVTSNEIEDA